MARNSRRLAIVVTENPSSILDNTMVPWHEIVSLEERGLILKQYGLNPDRMPQILRDDPVVQLLGAKRGDLIRIIRKSTTAGTTVYYRIVE